MESISHSISLSESSHTCIVLQEILIFIYFQPSDLSFFDYKIRSIFPMALHLHEQYKTTIYELNAQHVLYAH